MSLLTALLLRRVGVRQDKRFPHVPTNAERIQAFRAVAPPSWGNSYPWAWRQAERYARDAMADAEAVEIECGYAALSRGE